MKKGAWRTRVAMGVAGLAIMGAAARAADQAWQPPRIVKVTGQGSIFNYSWSLGTQATKDRPGAVLARDGELLLWKNEGEKADGKADKAKDGDDHREAQIIFPYLAGDGDTIAVKAGEGRGLLGGKVVSLDLGEGGKEDDPAWAWLEKASRDELAALRFVTLSEVPPPARLAALRRLAEANANLGLSLPWDPETLAVLSLFKPRWLLLSKHGDDDLAPDKIPPACLEKVDYLELYRYADAKTFALLVARPNLRTLILQGWRPADTGPLPRACEALQTLTLRSPLGENYLAPLAGIPKLRELHVVNSRRGEQERKPKPVRIGALAALTELKALTLTGCWDVHDLAVLEKLPGLAWLGLPPTVTQEQLAAAVRDHPDLRGLELLKCKRIEDLSPLRGLAKLEVLALGEMKAKLDPLAGLKSLRLLVLPMDAFEKTPDDVAKLEKQLPQCQIVPGGGLCMGSGWILLLVPAAALARLVLRRRPGNHH